MLSESPPRQKATDRPNLSSHETRHTATPPEVGALGRALASPLPPEVLFGIGGGTGFGRIPNGEKVTLLTRITSRETNRQAFLATICQHLQVPWHLHEAPTPQALRKTLAGALSMGRVPISWVYPDLLPWPAPPAAYHAVAVLEMGRDATVYDGQERRLPTDALLRATVTPGSRHRMMLVDGHPGELSTAVRAGLELHLQQMREGFGPPPARSNFGLAALAQWAVLVEEDNAQGAALADQIELRGGGPAMREAQAAFLAYAGHERAGAAAAAAAARWRALAEDLRHGRADADQVRAVHDAEAESLAAVDAALRGR
jgi:hypothetical protein